MIYFAKNTSDFPSSTGVYMISFINSESKKCYIGSASSVRKFKCMCGFRDRWRRHVQDLRKGRHHSKILQRAYEKYGEDNMYFKILEEVEPSYCLNREQFYIESMDTCSNGYNMLPHAKSSSNVINTKKIDEINKEKYLIKYSKELKLLKKLYEEGYTQKSISSMLGVNICTVAYRLKFLGIHKQRQKRKIYQYDLSGNLVNIWKNITACKNHYNVTYDTIRRVLRCGGIQALGFFFSYENLSPEEVVKIYTDRLNNWKKKISEVRKNEKTKDHMSRISKLSNKQKKCIKNICQMDTQGNIIKVWASSNDIQKMHGKSYKAGVLACVNGRQKTHKGFKWSIVDAQLSHKCPIS